jgi:hypothetical protein
MQILIGLAWLGLAWLGLAWLGLGESLRYFNNVFATFPKIEVSFCNKMKYPM